MDERWYYRYFDREVGPLDFRSLQALAEAGQIGQEDVVRTDRARAWVKAKTIPNLFTQAASVDDLDAMLESVVAEATSSASSGSQREEGCYCLVMGRELGPMSFEELGELARKGELMPRHKVRVRANADWIDAGSIIGLFEEEPQRDTSDLSSMMASAPVAEAADFELQRSTPTLSPQRRSDSDVETIEREWFWKFMGNETGPFTFEAIHEMAQSGRLTRTDQLRCGSAGEWVAADSIVGLFPDEADDDEPEEEDDEFRFEDFVEDGVAQHRKRKALAARGRKSGRRDGRPGTPRKPTKNEPETRTPVAAPATERPTPAPAPVAEQPRPAPVPMPTPSYAAPPPYVPPSIPAPVRPVPIKTKQSWDSSSLNINWKYVGVGAAVVLIGLSLWQFGLPSFGGNGFGSGVVGETLGIWNEAMLLHQPEYEGPRWDEFKERTLPRVKELAAELEKEGGSDPEAQALLKCHKEYLPVILEAGPTAKPKEWTDMANCIATISS